MGFRLHPWQLRLDVLFAPFGRGPPISAYFFNSRWVPLAFGLAGSTCKAAGFFVYPISGGCAFIAVESSV